MAKARMYRLRPICVDLATTVRAVSHGGTGPANFQKKTAGRLPRRLSGHACGCQERSHTRSHRIYCTVTCIGKDVTEPLGEVTLRVTVEVAAVPPKEMM